MIARLRWWLLNPDQSGRQGESGQILQPVKSQPKEQNVNGMLVPKSDAWSKYESRKSAWWESCWTIKRTDDEHGTTDRRQQEHIEQYNL